MKNEVFECEEFNYDGYQVVRGEFFAHMHEPSVSFNNYKIYVNTACINKLPNTDYVHILVNSKEKMLVIRPCLEEEKDSFLWCAVNKKRKPKQITCRIFFAKIMQLMDWNVNYRYKLIGKLVHTSNEALFVFDMKTAETFTRLIKNNKQITSRTPSFPLEWKEQFGLPVDEHRKSLEINIYNGYAVFGLKENKQQT